MSNIIGLIYINNKLNLNLFNINIYMVLNFLRPNDQSTYNIS